MLWQVVRERVIGALESSAKLPASKAQEVEDAIFVLSGRSVTKVRFSWHPSLATDRCGTPFALCAWSLHLGLFVTTLPGLSCLAVLAMEISKTTVVAREHSRFVEQYPPLNAFPSSLVSPFPERSLSGSCLSGRPYLTGVQSEGPGDVLQPQGGQERPLETTTLNGVSATQRAGGSFPVALHGTRKTGPFRFSLTAFFSGEVEESCPCKAPRCDPLFVRARFLCSSKTRDRSINGRWFLVMGYSARLATKI